MTIPKDIPEKWFPIVLPLQQKKQQGLDAAKTKKKWTEEERRVRANDREYNEKFQCNCIMTSKYNVITFLPVNLSRKWPTLLPLSAHTAVESQISSLSWFTTIVPLVLVLSITAFRHKSDNQVNNRQSQVVIHGSLQKEKWMNVRVGDIIKLENNQFVAADLLLLSSSEPHSLCYIETAELDGETNMKVRQSLSVTAELGDPNNLASFDGEVVCEPPNNKLDRFCGLLYWRDCKYPLSNQNMLLRGCVLRNTETCYGLVIFAGPDTKLMQNSGRTKFKRTSIDRLMNTLVLWIFGFLVCMGVILAVGNAVWEREVGSLFQSYLAWDLPVDNFLFSAFLSFWSYVIILNTVVPISLYVSVEVIRLGHSYFINWDRKMFCPRCNTAAEARTTTLNEELGQSKCECVLLSGEVIDPLGAQPKRLDFSSFNPLADPDFLGGVTAARNFGFVFRSRTPVRNPEGRIRLYCKGADTLLFERLHPSNHHLMNITTDHLNLLGATAIEDKLQEGVPETIAILSLANIKIWVLTGDKQETAVNIGYSCKMLTGDMTEVFIISGQTVLSVREELRRARERMIEFARTREGGKEERMEGWGEACSLGNGFWGGGGDGGVGGREWPSVGEKQQPCPPPPGPPPPRPPSSTTLDSISGEFALAHALEADMEGEFVSTACACRAVICCRVTPLQKALVVELIKKHKKAVTLAIGDGANDVSMIKTAHIGVGISGQEGIQAVLASDYSFSQFRFLQRLLLVHGRWSYLRMCRFLCYFFYKNFAFTMVHFWFGFFCGFSAQDVPEQRSLEYPKLYEPGQLNLLFNKREFFICITQGIYTSVVLFFVPYAILSHGTQGTGEPLADYQTFAVTTATALVIVVSVQIALDTGYWTAINHFFVWGSVGSFFTIMLAMHSQTLFSIFPNQFHFIGSAQSTLVQPLVWLTIALATVICIVPVLAFRFLKLDLKPQLSDTVRYTQLVRQKTRKPAGRCMGGVRGVPEGRLGARGGSRRSGYAFAHQEGFGELITSGKNMRLSSLALANFASRHSSSWIDTLRKKKHSNTHPPQSASGESSPAPSYVSGSAPPLSNSSSLLGGSQDTPLEEGTHTPPVILPQPAGVPSTNTPPALAPAQVPSADSLTPTSVRSPGGDSVGGWNLSLGAVQDALFGWRGAAARISGTSSPGPPPVPKETNHAGPGEKPDSISTTVVQT
ncbi:unnamed protein product [Coregonus sp. 'balchen']|nr:unnamed protein product [Coregonus sp. 'balchen']